MIGQTLCSDNELIERIRFGRQALFELFDQISSQLQHASGRNTALSPTLQVLIALRFYANRGLYNTARYKEYKEVHRTRAHWVIRMSLAFQCCLRHYIHRPTQDEAPSEYQYLYCKGVHSINVKLSAQKCNNNNNKKHTTTRNM